jgi:hypothetical protein
MDGRRLRRNIHVELRNLLSHRTRTGLPYTTYRQRLSVAAKRCLLLLLALLHFYIKSITTTGREKLALGTKASTPPSLYVELSTLVTVDATIKT